MKLRLIFLSLLGAVLLLATGVAQADEVRLKNGDRLSGTVLEMTGGKLVLKTSYAGKIKIDWSQVTGLTTDKPLCVQGQGGKISQGQALSAGGGELKLSQDGKAQVLALSQVKAINPEDKDPFKITGSISLGMNSTRGNTNKYDQSLLGQAVATWKTINRATAGFESYYAEKSNHDTDDNSLAYLEYNRFMSKDWYWLANLRWEQDRFKDLQFRGITGAGIGYQVWRSPPTNLAIEFGPNFVYEEYTDNHNKDYYAWRLQLNYSRWFFDHFVQFWHRGTSFSQIDDMSNLFFTTRQGLKLPLGYGLFTNLQFNLDFDSQPAPGKSQFDNRFIFSLGYEW
jgi:putative salt-induced outer membrane protein YdiY